jgi:hypothetical protein
MIFVNEDNDLFICTFIHRSVAMAMAPAPVFPADIPRSALANLPIIIIIITNETEALQSTGPIATPPPPPAASEARKN